MKALSIRQPWAWLITQGFKDIENRTWATKFRGQFLIHASKGMTKVEYEDTKYYIADIAPDIVLPQYDLLERGGVVGMATLTNCVANSGSIWHQPNCWGFALADVQPLPFIACKGALNFFSPPQDVTDQVHHLLSVGVEENVL